MAVAAVDTGDKQPQPVVVLQVKDAAKADAGLTKLQACDSGAESSFGGGSGSNTGSDTGTDTGSDTGTGGWSVDGDWAVVAESDATAKKVADAAADASLADDAAYQKWTGEVGDPGVVTMYAAPAAGRYLADNLGQLEGMLSSSGSCAVSSSPSAAPGSAAYSSDLSCTDTGMGGGMGGGVPSDATDALKQFEGMAATIRFNDGALELEGAGDPGKASAQQLASSDKGDDVVTTLPADTAAALGAGFPEGWFTKLVDQLASSSGMSASDLMDQMSQTSGLDLPADAETLTGDSMALSIGSGFDPETLVNSTDGSGVPIAAKIQGDSDGIDGVLAKLRPQMGAEASMLGSDSSGDMTAVGPDPDYRSQVLGHGNLGDSAVFKDVVREADKASALFYVNFDTGDDWLSKLAGGDQQVADNLKPLEGLGMSTWVDGGASHLVLRLTTD